jgi:hypothetical protein
MAGKAERSTSAHKESSSNNSDELDMPSETRSARLQQAGLCSAASVQSARQMYDRTEPADTVGSWRGRLRKKMIFKTFKYSKHTNIQNIQRDSLSFLFSFS